MPLFSPRRFQPPFYPVRRERWPQQAVAAVERTVKGALFGCRMCGNCILQETAFVCPMTCPKGLRNGLCGDATPDHCAVDPSRPCTWYKIYERAKRLGRSNRLLEINAPLDGNQAGRETWIGAFQLWRRRQQGPSLSDLLFNRQKFQEEWERFFYALRQPAWWQGDAAYHAPAYDEPISRLEAALRSGVFVTTAEIAPPLGAATKGLVRKIDQLQTYVTAANYTDNASAAARMSSLACSKLSLDHGLEPVMQLQARDRTRVAIQSEAMGAAGLGVPNILCLSGDHNCLGPAPMAKPDQFDLDAIQMLWVLRRLRDEGVYMDGRAIKERPRFFLGAAASPFGAPAPYEAIRAEKKINAGAQFIQTQPIFDYDRFTDWLEALDKRNLLGKVHILAGVLPLKSAAAAHVMTGGVPGVVIPPALLKRMDEAGDKEGQQQEGVAIALQIIEKLQKTAGIHGMHIMAVHWEEIVPRLVTESGVPRPGEDKNMTR